MQNLNQKNRIDSLGTLVPTDQVNCSKTSIGAHLVFRNLVGLGRRRSQKCLVKAFIYITGTSFLVTWDTTWEDIGLALERPLETKVEVEHRLRNFFFFFKEKLKVHL